MRLQFSPAAAVLALSSLSWDINAFAPMMRNSFHVSKSSFTSPSTSTSHHPSVLFAAGGGNLFRPTKHSNNDDEDDEDEEEDEDDDDEEESLYEQFATSEFLDNETSSQITTTATSNTDWGGEYNTLRSRFEDQKNNKVGPSRALFRTMTTQTPNEAIMSFISGANPQVVTAMSGAVKSLLGGLTNPGAGIETIVKANGEKLGTLCFQLQMTGYMFRNAEYVLAIRDLMNIQGSATFDEYKVAFDKLDKDGSGFIEVDEIDQLLTEVYDEETPAVEIEAFLQFFDVNNDGKISWEEFERGLGIVADTKAKESRKRKGRLALPADINMINDEDDDEEDDDDDDDDDEREEQQQEQIMLLREKEISPIHKLNENQESKGGRHGGRYTTKNVPYTRSGDKGTSVLLTGERRTKDDDAFEAMGTVDELCSVVGVAHAELSRIDSQICQPSGNNNDSGVVDYGELNDWLLDIMSRLFDLGSHVAKPRKKNVEEDNDDTDDDNNDDDDTLFEADGVGGGFDKEHIDILEDWIDILTEVLPELTSFVLPTGGPASAQLHVARCVCRRAERRVLPLVRQGICDPNALQYLNRLSDFLFTAARWTNYCEGREEIQYMRHFRGAKQRGRVTISLRDEKKKDF